MSKTEDWLAWADTHKLPDEDIKIASGGPQGWPSGMLGEVTAKNLHDMGITKVSTICQDALSMNKEQFEAKYGRAWTKIHAVAEFFARTVQNPERMAELKRRLSAAAPPAKSAPNIPRCPDGHLLVNCNGTPYSFLWFSVGWMCDDCKQTLPKDAPGVMRCGACSYDCCQKCQAKKGWKK